MAVGKNIKKIRLQRNYTQKYVAQFLGTSHANYGKMENGVIGISKERLRKVAEILEVSFEEVMGRQQEV